ncbi:MAG: cupin domain-containing protein [Amphiplicatus sp.]
MRGVFLSFVISIAGICVSCTNETPAETLDNNKARAASTDDAGLAWGPCPEIFPAGCEIAVLHGDPSKPNADIFLRVPGGYEIPAHWHNSAERIILVAGELSVRYRDHPTASLYAGDYAYGPAKLPHDAQCTSVGSCILFIAFEKAVDAEAYAGSLD